MSKYIEDGWYDEPFFDRLPFEKKTGFKVKKVLYDGWSDYQNILIFESSHHGQMLVLNGGIQLAEADEFSYHEMLAFSALSCHTNPKRVLIIGGGDGGMAKQVLKFPSVEELVVCDIDQLVVDKCKEFFPGLTSSFNDPKCTLMIDDAFAYLLKCEQESFDVIINDCTDPDDEVDDGVSNPLFGRDFYSSVFNALTKNGILCAQTANSLWQQSSTATNMLQVCRTIFPVVKIGFVSVPTFFCGQNGFMLASKTANHDVSKPYWKFSDEILDGMNMKYYDADVHTAALCLPRFFKKTLEKDEMTMKSVDM